MTDPVDRPEEKPNMEKPDTLTVPRHPDGRTAIGVAIDQFGDGTCVICEAVQQHAALARLRGALQQIAALGDGESFEELFDQALGLAKAALADAPAAPLTLSIPQKDLPEDAVRVLQKQGWELYGEPATPVGAVDPVGEQVTDGPRASDSSSSSIAAAPLEQEPRTKPTFPPNRIIRHP